MVCVQYVYFAANFIFVILGTFLITIATVTQWIPREFCIFLDWVGEPIQVLKFIGIALFVLPLIVNFASFTQSTLLFSTYGAFLVTLLVVEFNFGIRAFSIYDTCESVTASSMKAALNKYHYSTKTNWDYIQQQLRCCGIHNSSDWESYNIQGPEITTDENSYNIPCSCCADVHCLNTHSTGCLNIICGYVTRTWLILFYTIIGIAVAKVWLLIFSCIFTISRKDDERDQQQHIRNSPNSHELNPPSSRP